MSTCIAARATCLQTQEPLCRRCMTRAAAAIPRLVYDYRDPEQQLFTYPSQRLDGQPGRSAETPIPLRTDVEALQRSIWWVTTTWAEVLCDHHHLEPPDWLKRTRNGWATQWACGLIAPRTATLMQFAPQQLADYPIDGQGQAVRHQQVSLLEISGARGLLDMAWLHDRARSMLGLTELVRRLPGYCRKCSRPELYQDNGSDTVYCGACQYKMTRDDYERYGNVFLRSAA